MSTMIMTHPEHEGMSARVDDGTPCLQLKIGTVEIWIFGTGSARPALQRVAELLTDAYAAPPEPTPPPITLDLDDEIPF